MKQTVLIPTDFSKNALVATRYALDLVEGLGAEVHILHAYSAFTSAFQSQLANHTDNQRAKAGAEKGMTDFLAELGDYPNHAITSSIVKDNLVDAIREYLETHHTISLIIMGTHGASGPRKDWLGSNTYDVAKEIDTPLLVVPEHYGQFRLERIVFFTDYQEEDHLVLYQLKKLLGNNHKLCTLVHITENHSESEEIKLTDWAHQLTEKSDYNLLETSLILDQEQLVVVNTILEKLDADLCLLTLVEGRSFFEKLIHKSLAKEIILNPNIPVLLRSNRK